MLSKSSYYGAFLLLLFRTAQAQEGNIPSSLESKSTTITLTAATAPADARPTNYYSSVHPQVTLPSSSEPSSGLPVAGAKVDNSLNGGIIAGITIGLVFAVILLCAVTFFIIRRRRQQNAVQTRRASWVATHQWTSDQKPPETSETPSYRGDAPSYPFNVDGAGRVRTPSPTTAHHGVIV